MNITNITMTVRTCLVAATIVATGFATTSCGDEVQPPKQDIGVQLPEPEVKHYEPACNTPAYISPCPDPSPRYTSKNRKQFDDEYAPAD